MSTELYENPLITRYASATWLAIWSAQNRHSDLATVSGLQLAECQQELGLCHHQSAQLQQMRDDGRCRSILLSADRLRNVSCGTT
jgi:hypothetical protein